MVFSCRQIDRYGEFSQHADGVIERREVTRVRFVASVYPGRLHSGTGGTMDVPGVHGDQQHFACWFDAAGRGTVLGGGPSRFLRRRRFNGQEPLELVPDSSLVQQPFGYLG